MSRGARTRLSVHELAEEIVRRVMAESFDGRSLPYVIRLSDPPTASEQLQLLACALLKRPVAIMPAKILTVGEWVKRYSGPIE